MILAAAILLFGISSTGLSSQDSPVQAQPTAKSEQSSASGDQSNPEQTNSPTPHTTAPPKSDSSSVQESAQSSKASTAKKRARKKKVSIAPCDASNSAGQASSNNASSAPAAQSAGTSATPAKDCPPPKIVVRQGGTVEPSIQLAGGAKVSQNQTEANQFLGSTEANLKKIAGLQLNEAQKDTVVQIRQFVDQSKAALAAGDAERGRTLAWKAELLSQDLVQPQK